MGSFLTAHAFATVRLAPRLAQPPLRGTGVAPHSTHAGQHAVDATTMDHPLNQASLDGLDEMDKILKGMAELDGDTSPHADQSLEALRRGEKSLSEEWPAGMD